METMTVDSRKTAPHFQLSSKDKWMSISVYRKLAFRSVGGREDSTESPIIFRSVRVDEMCCSINTLGVEKILYARE